MGKIASSDMVVGFLLPKRYCERVTLSAAIFPRMVNIIIYYPPWRLQLDTVS